MGTEIALKKLTRDGSPFVGTPEYELIKKLHIAADAKRSDDFTEAVKDFEKIHHLDSWTKKLLDDTVRKISDALSNGQMLV